MGFVKVVKNKSYFRRFQVKYRRRREAKTDYYARKRLITQDKNKYKTPKYRLVVRVTNRDVITQIIAADLTHDVCIAAAYSHELPRYGVKYGLTNYAACYATGLLLARRVNAKFNLKYEGNTDVNGEDYNVEADEEGAAPFKALLDVGLARTTSGAKIFGALKGACDGGLDVPHNDHRFPGSKRENGEWQTSPETHRKYIFGLHVSTYMKQLEEENEEAYNKQFKRYIDAGVKADSFEKMYKAAHAAIRKEPTKARAATELGFFGVRAKAKTGKETYEKKHYNRTKISLQQRQARITQKLTAKGIKSIAPKKQQKA
jgi:large subunit ribosomal protein L5e